jgi:hypothetical protein
MADAYCRSCRAAFPRPLPAPYGALCPNCLARGDIVTLTDVPRKRMRSRDRSRGDLGSGSQPARREPTTRPLRYH